MKVIIASSSALSIVNVIIAITALWLYQETCNDLSAKDMNLYKYYIYLPRDLLIVSLVFYVIAAPFIIICNFLIEREKYLHIFYYAYYYTSIITLLITIVLNIIFISMRGLPLIAIDEKFIPLIIVQFIISFTIRELYYSFQSSKN